MWSTCSLQTTLKISSCFDSHQKTPSNWKAFPPTPPHCSCWSPSAPLRFHCFIVSFLTRPFSSDPRSKSSSAGSSWASGGRARTKTLTFAFSLTFV